MMAYGEIKPLTINSLEKQELLLLKTVVNNFLARTLLSLNYNFKSYLFRSKFVKYLANVDFPMSFPPQIRITGALTAGDQRDQLRSNVIKTETF